MGVSAVDFLLLVVGVRSYSPENMNESCLEVLGVVVDLLHITWDVGCGGVGSVGLCIAGYILASQDGGPK